MCGTGTNCDRWWMSHWDWAAKNVATPSRAGKGEDLEKVSTSWLCPEA